MANQFRPLHKGPQTFIPVAMGYDDVRMVPIDEATPRYVRAVDHDDVVNRLQSELDLVRCNEADARRSAMEVSQREARWMMIEERLRRYISETGLFIPEGTEPSCVCPRCEALRGVLNVLNLDPPIGDGFQTEKGLSLTGSWLHNLSLERLEAEAHPFPIPPEIAKAIGEAKQAEADGGANGKEG